MSLFYEKLKKKNTDSEYIDKNWSKWCKEIAVIYNDKDLVLKFSENNFIIKTMTGEPIRDHNRGMLENIDKRFRKYIIEEYLGNNLLINKKLNTSASRLGHLYIVSLIYNILKENKITYSSIVELGGGFGGLMSILIREFPSSEFKIFDIVDILPLQWMYLNVVCRGDVDERELGFNSFKDISEIACDSAQNSLFISNWALTESTEKLQKFAIQTKFFGASSAIICCEDNNINHPDSKFMHDYLYSSANAVIRLTGAMKNSKLFFLNLS
jgi:hypothetical protein